MGDTLKISDGIRMAYDSHLNVEQNSFRRLGCASISHGNGIWHMVWWKALSRRLARNLPSQTLFQHLGYDRTDSWNPRGLLGGDSSDMMVHSDCRGPSELSRIKRHGSIGCSGDVDSMPTWDSHCFGWHSQCPTWNLVP